MKAKIEKMFGSFLFDDTNLKKYVPKRVYKEYKCLKDVGEPLNALVARSIAKGIKKWALKMGATHYSHWFLPLTGKSAEKQVSFLEIDKKGNFIEDFDEKALIKGETDASSFPNGGDRLTFEARGYTVWDYTSPIFIKEDLNGNRVLYIPTAFCSYHGLALDEKTPLLRSAESLNIQALRVLNLLGYKNVKKVFCDVGAEQEYFLIKKEDYEKRFDLKMTGRTLLGAKPTKSQEVHSHYFGVINDQISAFMNEVDCELWKVGVSAKLQHNEVAPSQYELVPIYNNANVSNDQNQIIMETLNRIAKKHGFEVLFHEKPFNYLNGSGKHINWSLSTDTGINLLNVNLKDKTLFLTFFVSVIAAINSYYDLIRCSVAYRGNDLRLGEKEAPPSLISVFIGNELENLLNTIGSIKENKSVNSQKLLDTRVKALPKMVKDYCDRNRTSPFAFGGNKFEFRMSGSSQAIAWPTCCINTAVAKILNEIANELEKKHVLDESCVLELLKNMILKHKRIIFNGNSFDKAWEEEAKKRGIKNYASSLDCYKLLENKNIEELFEQTCVLNREELSLKKNTLVNTYVDSVLVEIKTIREMINKKIYPSLVNYYNQVKDLKVKSAKNISKTLEDKMDAFYNYSLKLDKFINESKEGNYENYEKKCKTALKLLDEIREEYDEFEPFIPNDLKPYPFYNDILY